MLDSDCEKLLSTVQTFLIWGPTHDPLDVADLLSLLGRLEPAHKAIFWRWLGDHHPKIQHWLSSKRVPSG